MIVAEFLNLLKKYSNCSEVYLDVGELGYYDGKEDFLAEQSNPLFNK